VDLAAGITLIVATLVAAILSNTFLELLVAVVVGRGWFRSATAGALGVMAFTIVAELIAG
jgi:hypothetical protein